MKLDDRLRARLDDLAARGLARRLPSVTERDGVQYRLDGRPVVGFSSNDYLGLADALDLRSPRPSGAGSSRLICGDNEVHRKVERRLAEHAGYEDAVLFPSGYQLNTGVLPALIDPTDLVYSDTLNHASIIDGLRLAKAKPLLLPHGARPEPRESNDMRWWVTESIFSMDGDATHPEPLRDFIAEGGCAYVDDAHAIGLFANGGGYVQHHGLEPSVYVGPLGKAFGCAGAFVAASRTVCTWIRTRARSFVFTTGVTPVLASAVHHALDIIQDDQGDELRRRLWSNVQHVATQLGAPDDVTSAIFPVVVGDNQTALACTERLLELGFHVQAIRPPTVPSGTARLRITVTANHTAEQIEDLAHALRTIFDALELPLRVQRGTTRAPA